MNAITQQVTRQMSKWLHGDAGQPSSLPGPAVPSQGRRDDPRGDRREDGAVPVRDAAGARIRRRRPDDVDSCARILRGISSGGRYPVPRPASHRDWLTENLLDAWVAERRGLVLGHVALTEAGTSVRAAMRWHEVTGRPVAELAAVSRFFVRVPDRGRGIGSRLLATAAAEARDRGMLPVSEVVGSDRYGIAIFEREGWRLAGRYPLGERGDERVLYLYTLPPSA